MMASSTVEVPDEPQAILRALYTEAARLDPHPFYDRLRQLAPVYRDEDSGLWFLSRWEDCNRILRSDRFGQDGRMKQDPRYGTSSSLQLLGENITGMDPPEHTRLRIMALRGLSRARVEHIKGYLAELTTTILDELETRDEFDLVADYATLIPGTVICEMLGVPREDHGRFDGWIADQFRILSPLPASDELLAETDANVDLLLAYLGDIIEQRRREPKDDLISAFVATDEAAGEPMTAREAVLMANVLLAGGSDTTKSVISFGTQALLENPDQLKNYLDNPAGAQRALEELIRVSGPVLIANPRKSYDEIEIGGRTIAAGDVAAAVLVSANFDPTVFKDPYRLNLARDPNPHLAFGHGAHICVGNMLARAVGGHAIGALVRRFPDLSIVPGSFEPRLDLFALRGLKSLKVRRS